MEPNRRSAAVSQTSRSNVIDPATRPVVRAACIA